MELQVDSINALLKKEPLYLTKEIPSASSEKYLFRTTASCALDTQWPGVALSVRGSLIRPRPSRLGHDQWHNQVGNTR
jgi:hypothetical protein